MTGPVKAVRTCLRKYVTISGRAARSEFWWFAVFVTLVGAALYGIGMLVPGIRWGDLPILEAILTLIMLLPLICVSGRRFHDYDLSAWWLLIGLIPVLGGLFLLSVFLQRGTTGDNPYGPDPLAGPAPQ